MFAVAPDQSRRRFVLHEHHKPRHHFDLRLEEEGVLRSWAVPRGLPEDPTDDRLAIAVSDTRSITSPSRTRTRTSPTRAPGRSTTGTPVDCSSRCTGATGPSATHSSAPIVTGFCT